MRKLIAALLCVSLAFAGVPAATTAQTGGEATTGTHISFGVANDAVTGYTVGGTEMFSSFRMQSQSSAVDEGLIEANLDEITSIVNINAAGLSVEAETSASTTLNVSSSPGAYVRAHDNGHGTFRVAPGQNTQVGIVNVSSNTELTVEGEEMATLTADNGAEATFMVVGTGGEVATNEDGNLAVRLGANSDLIFKAYPDGKSDAEAEQESLISDGIIGAEVHVMEQDGERVIDAASYNTFVNYYGTEEAANGTNFTFGSARGTGTLVVTHVSEAAVGSLSSVEAYVNSSNGENTVPVEADSAATGVANVEQYVGSPESAYYAVPPAEGSASTDVVVAINHFSNRTVTMGQNVGPSDTSGSGGVPGFGAPAAIAALLALAAFARRLN